MIAETFNGDNTLFNSKNLQSKISLGKKEIKTGLVQRHEKTHGAVLFLSATEIKHRSQPGYGIVSGESG